MERLRVPVYFDFASTLCHVAHRCMERQQAEWDALGLELDWRPLDLVRITGWPRGAPVEGPRRDNALRVARDLGVEVRMPRHWMDSRPANAIGLALAGRPEAASWRERVFTGVYEEGVDLDEPGAIERFARDLGLDARALTQLAGDALAASTRAAHEAGVTGVPTFLLDGWPFGGIQDDFTMRSLLSRWAERKRARESA